MQNGEIFYDGTLYENIPLLYDIVGQETVINRYNSDERIQLINAEANTMYHFYYDESALDSFTVNIKLVDQDAAWCIKAYIQY